MVSFDSLALAISETTASSLCNRPPTLLSRLTLPSSMSSSQHTSCSALKARRRRPLGCFLLLAALGTTSACMTEALHTPPAQLQLTLDCQHIEAPRPPSPRLARRRPAPQSQVEEHTAFAAEATLVASGTLASVLPEETAAPIPVAGSSSLPPGYTLPQPFEWVGNQKV